MYAAIGCSKKMNLASLELGAKSVWQTLFLQTDSSGDAILSAMVARVVNGRAQ
jgi:hypothetical protein